MADNNAPDKQVDSRDEQGRFVPGVSGNPSGRPPKGYAISDVMRQMLDEKPEIKKALSAKLFELALQGDLAAIREVMDRLEGKPIQKQEIGGIDGDPLVIVTDASKAK